jgi:hypothetical protein
MLNNLANSYTTARNAVCKRDHCKVGNYSIQGTVTSGNVGGIFYPSTHNLDLDTTYIGGKYNVPILTFFIRRDPCVATDHPPAVFIEIGKGDPVNNDYYYCDLGSDVAVVNQWNKVSLPIGAYANNAAEGNITWHTDGSPDWTQVDYIQFYLRQTGAHSAHLYVDDLQINGFVLRAATNTTNIDATYPRMVFVNDMNAKDDSCSPSDDSGLIAQCAYAELLKRQTSPVLGTLTTLMIKGAMPGQKVHVHAKKTSAGSFRIDKNFRITKVTFVKSGSYQTIFNVTDDLVNSHARMRSEDIRQIMAQARPNFQDRQASSLKTMDVDITQAVLSQDYPS